MAFFSFGQHVGPMKSAPQLRHAIWEAISGGLLGEGDGGRRAIVQAKWDSRKERRALAAHIERSAEKPAPAATRKGGRL